VKSLESRRQKKKQTKQGPSTPIREARTGEESAILERPRQATEALLRQTTTSNKKEGLLEVNSGAWRVKLRDGDPKKTIMKVPVEVDPIEPNTKVSSRQKAAEKRNYTRISEADQKDETVLSEYLSGYIGDVLPSPIEGPDDSFDPG
jgi:hypothetical protein